MELLSDVRLGMDLGLLTGINRRDINEIMLESQPASLQKRRANNSDTERDVFRSELIRKAWIGGVFMYINERFTERAQRVIIIAQQEAASLSHNYVGTEHLLLGLVKEGKGMAAQVLKSMSGCFKGYRKDRGTDRQGVKAALKDSL